jgi:hypothetical protein
VVDPGEDVEAPVDGVDTDDPDEFRSDESLRDDEERERG